MLRPGGPPDIKVYTLSVFFSTVLGSYFLATYAVPRLLMKKKNLQFALVLVGTISITLVTYWLVAPKNPESLFAHMPPEIRPPAGRAPLPLQFLLVVYSFPSMIIFFKKLLDGEIEKRTIEQEQLRTELNFLKNQISPHFLFNSLNTIYALTSSDNARAGKITMQLSRLLRYLVYDTEKEKEVSIEVELEFLRNYIELSKMRLQENMKVRLDADIDDPNFKIPPLILLIFVENSFKHGVTTLENSEISFRLKQIKDELWFETTNRKPGSNGGKEKAGGVGIQNVLRRLELLYGEDNFNLTFGDDGERYHVKLWLKNYEN